MTQKKIGYLNKTICWLLLRHKVGLTQYTVKLLRNNTESHLFHLLKVATVTNTTKPYNKAIKVTDMLCN